MDDSQRDKSASEFADIGRDMFLAGLVGSHSGNMSVRLDDRVVITRRGARLGRLSADDLVEFRLFHDEIPYEASTESSVHLAVYAISDHLAVIHAHPTSAIAASLIERGAAFVPQTLEAAHYIPRVPVVDAPAGTAVGGDVRRDRSDYCRAPCRNRAWTRNVFRRHFSEKRIPVDIGARRRLQGDTRAKLGRVKNLA